jgi:hypothetical protein
MSMDQAAIFLASSILGGLAAVIITVVVLIINNLLHKYWRPFNLYKIVDPYSRPNEPQFEEKTDKDKK